MDLGKLYEKQISITEWFQNIKHGSTETLRVEDNEKRVRLGVLNEVIGLPYDKPHQFSALDIANLTENFKRFLDEHGEELCALRLMPSDSSLPKIRMRGQKIKDVLKWFNEQKIDHTKYKADFVPHPETPIWSSIFIVNDKGIFGELIRGGHHQLTQGFHDKEKPIVFSFDFNSWTFSERNREAEEHALQIVNSIKVQNKDSQILLSNKLGSSFRKDYLYGYFETAQSAEFGTWFIDYNLTIADLYHDFKPVIGEQNDSFIKGQPASLGKISGKVRKVSFEELSNVTLTENDILVCNVTTPDYFTVMQQAGGIITDSGGILSHAAIVARELGKPCIVGTSKATELLNEGDLIELDAFNGIVRKI